MEMFTASPGLFCRFLLWGWLRASLGDRAPVIVRPQINHDRDLGSCFPLCHLHFFLPHLALAHGRDVLPNTDQIIQKEKQLFLRSRHQCYVAKNN